MPPRTASTHVRELLLACAAASPEATDERRLRELAQRVDPNVLAHAAARHRVVGFAYQALRRVDAGNLAALSRLERYYRDTLAAQLRAVAALQQTRAALDPTGIRWLVVKGPVLAELAYRRRGVRTYEDVDVIVDRRDFGAAVAALESAGFEVADRNWQLIRRVRAGELQLARPRGASVDLHWHLVYEQTRRHEFRIPMDELLERARRVELPTGDAFTLDAADALIHVALHACREGGDRLIWLVDLERLIANDPPEWGAVGARARAWGVHLAVASMLLRARSTVGARIPDAVVRELVPSRAWRSALTATDRLFPVSGASGGRTPATILAQATGRSVPRTLASILRAAEVSARSRLRRRVESRSEWSRDDWKSDPSHPESLLHPTGDERDRARFLADVAAGDGAPARSAAASFSVS